MPRFKSAESGVFIDMSCELKNLLIKIHDPLYMTKSKFYQ